MKLIISNAQNKGPLRNLLKYMKIRENFWNHVKGQLSHHVAHSEG